MAFHYKETEPNSNRYKLEKKDVISSCTGKDKEWISFRNGWIQVLKCIRTWIPSAGSCSAFFYVGLTLGQALPEWWQGRSSLLTFPQLSNPRGREDLFPYSSSESPSVNSGWTILGHMPTPGVRDQEGSLTSTVCTGGR